MVASLVFFSLAGLTTSARFLAGAIYSSRTTPADWAMAEFAWLIWLGAVFLVLGLIYLVWAELENRSETPQPAPPPDPQPKPARKPARKP